MINTSFEKIRNLSLFLFAALILVFLTGTHLSFSVFFLVFYSFGILTCLHFSDTKITEFKNLLFILICTSSTYFIYSLFLYIDYKNQGGFSTFPDQNYFYNVANSTKEFSTLIDGLKSITSQRIHSESYAVHILSGTIAYFSEKHLSGNSVLLQSFVVACFATFTNIFLYKTLRFYVDKKAALTYTLLFAFLSVNFAYSPWLLRDIHVLFFYTLGFYLAHKRFRLTTLLLFLVLQLIVVNLRPVSGLAFTFFPLLYIYTKGSKHKYKYLIYVLLALFVLLFSIKFFSLINSATNKLINYQTFTENTLSSSDGIGASLLKLPIGLKQIAIATVSQIQPFPFWGGIESAETLFECISTLIFGAAGVFWFYVIFVSVISFIKNKNNLPTILFLALVFFCVFILGNTSNMHSRRIMAVYPIAYTFFVYSQIHYNTVSSKKKTMKLFAVFYVFLLVLYIAFKYL